MIREIVDTHLHVWDPAVLRYPWLEDVELLNRPHLLTDYNAVTEGLPVRQMVFVQCEVDPLQFNEEAAWVTNLAESDERLAAIVPWAPLELGDDAAPELDALASNPLVKGIRRIIQFEDDPAFCLRPDFVRGVRLLGERDLHFEICLKGDDQFRNCLELVAQCPNVRFLLNHIGKPFIDRAIMSPWDDLMGALAAMPNTWCKVSGMVNEANMETWSADDLRPYLERVVAEFGWDRLMFGGDWPVVLLASKLEQWVHTLEDLSRSLGARDVELQKLFADNARSFYRLRS